MPQIPMYPGMVNSPQTELANDINDTQTTIEVLDGSVLPDAPNICTILGGELSETILYTSKSGNTLSGITRGLRGQARSWAQGQKVARNFSSYDWDSARNNIEDHESRITSHTSTSATNVHLAKNIGIEDAAGNFTSTDVEGALAELFQFANNGKSSIATVIGSPAKTSDTFAQLANTLQTLKNNLVSIMGVGAGTDAFNVLINTSLNAKRDELANKLGASTSLNLHALLNNTTDNTLQHLKNQLANNLSSKGQSASGTETLASLVGKVANIATGLKWASGVKNSVGNDFVVTGLSFSPKIVIVKFTEQDSNNGNYGGIFVYVNKGIMGLNYDIKYNTNWSGSIGSTTNDIQIDSNGFHFTAPWANKSYNWLAIGE